jgi:hypothetical protein
MAKPTPVTSWAVPSAKAKALARLPGQWRALWNQHTGQAIRIVGTGIPARGSVASPAIAREVARTFIRQHGDLLSGAEPDLREVSNALHDGIRTVGFVQELDGVLVLHSRVSFRFKNDRLFMVGAEAWSGIPENIVNILVTSQDAAAPAREWLSKEVGAPARWVETDKVAILPRPSGYEPVWPVSVRTDAPPTSYRVLVSTLTGKVVEAESLYRYGSAQVLFDAPPRWPGAGRAQWPAAYLQATVGDRLQSADSEGAFAVEESAIASLSVTGDRVRVHNEAGPAYESTVTLSAGTTHLVAEPDDELLDAQIAAYVHGSRAQAYAASMAPDVDWLRAERLNIHVNNGGEACNAYSDGSDIYFFQGDRWCENTGRIADVVMHEFGHSLHAHSVIWGVGDFESALSEGVSDYFASTITDDPGMGRGFYRSDAALRHLDDHDYRWPEDVDVDPHQTGLIIAGALWDMRTNLIASLGRERGVERADRLLAQALKRASDISSAYLEVLAADDDDGDLANGTPNSCDIDEAFARHGLADPAAVGRVGPPSREGLVVRVSTPLVQCPAQQLQKLLLHWHVGDEAAAEQLPMVADEVGYAATLPEVEPGTSVSYRVEAIMGNGDRRLFPENKADPWYQAYYGETHPLYCTDFEEPTDNQLWQRMLLAGDDVEGANDWQFGPPQGAQGSGDPTGAYSGDSVAGSDLGAGNYNGTYQANKSTELCTPAISVQGYRHVRLQYWRWLTVEDGFYDQAVIRSGDRTLWQNTSSGEGGDTHHIDREWRFQDLDLSGSARDGTVQVCFEVHSDAGLELGGWNIDDLCVVGVADADESAPEKTRAVWGSPPAEGCGCNQGAAIWPLALAIPILWRRRRTLSSR